MRTYKRKGKTQKVYTSKVYKTNWLGRSQKKYRHVLITSTTSGKESKFKSAYTSFKF